MRTGDWNELQWSLFYHQKHIPFLISSKLLRAVGAGQIDVAFIEKQRNWRASLIEIKNKSHPTAKQWQRLRKSQEYLSRILEIETILKVKFCQKDFDSLS